MKSPVLRRNRSFDRRRGALSQQRCADNGGNCHDFRETTRPTSRGQCKRTHHCYLHSDIPVFKFVLGAQRTGAPPAYARGRKLLAFATVCNLSKALRKKIWSREQSTAPAEKRED